MVIRRSPTRKAVSARNYAISEPGALDLLVAPVQSTEAGLHSSIIALTRYGVNPRDGSGEILRQTVKRQIPNLASLERFQAGVMRHVPR